MVRPLSAERVSLSLAVTGTPLPVALTVAVLVSGSATRLAAKFTGITKVRVSPTGTSALLVLPLLPPTAPPLNRPQEAPELATHVATADSVTPLGKLSLSVVPSASDGPV